MSNKSHVAEVLEPEQETFAFAKGGKMAGNEERIAGALTELIVGFFKTDKNNRVKYVREKLEKAISHDD